MKKWIYNVGSLLKDVQILGILTAIEIVADKEKGRETKIGKVLRTKIGTIIWPTKEFEEKVKRATLERKEIHKIVITGNTALIVGNQRVVRVRTSELIEEVPEVAVALL